MSKKKYVSAVLLCVTWLSNTAVFAGDEDLALLYGDEESVSIATGSSKPLHLAPSVASVITAEEIKAMGATDLDQVLETVPGLHVSRSFDRLNAIYSIRGIHTSSNPQVLFMVDGVRLTDGTTGARPPSFRLPVENIQRVEVVRGPGSAVYGADAFAGVINVVTKTYEGMQGLSSGARLGSFNSHDVWLQNGAPLGGWDTSFSLEWLKTAGDDSRVLQSDLQTVLDNAFSLVPGASLAPGPMNTKYDIIDTSFRLSRGPWKIGYWGWFQRDSGVGPGVAGALDNSGHTEIDSHVVDVDYHRSLSASLDLSARYSFQVLDQFTSFTLFPPGAVLPIGADGNIDFNAPAGLVLFPDGIIGNPGGKEDRHLLDLALIYSGLKRHRLRLGIGASDVYADTNEAKNFGPGVLDSTIYPAGPPATVDGTLVDVSNTTNVFMPNTGRRLWYLSLQDEWDFASDWALTAGVRYDDYSDVGDTLNPRLALVWAADYNLTGKLLYGRAFRAPAFSETQYINNPSILGNANLVPERIDTWELAFDYRPNFDSRIALNVFSYEVEELIQTVPDAGTSTNTYQNAAQQSGHGLEMEASWHPRDDLALQANLAWQQSEYKNGDTVPDAPGRQFFVAADWNMTAEVLLHAQANWVADRQRAAGDARPQIKDYVLTDMSLRYAAPGQPWEAGLTVRNLFDEHALIPSSGATPDYPMEQRSFLAEVRLHLD